MSIPSIVLVGAGGHAAACADVIEQAGSFAIAGMIGTREQVGTHVAGYAVIGTDEDLPRLRRTHAHALVTVGQIRTAAPRVRLWEVLTDGGWTVPTVVSPRAYVSAHSRIAAGTIVMHGAVVNAAADIGRNVIVNSMALVEHDVQVGDHCHIATAAVLNGGVRVGSRSFVGSATAVRQGVAIGDDCVIGMGQRILSDCAAGTTLPEAARRT